MNPTNSESEYQEGYEDLKSRHLQLEKDFQTNYRRFSDINDRANAQIAILRSQRDSLHEYCIKLNSALARALKELRTIESMTTHPNVAPGEIGEEFLRFLEEAHSLVQGPT